MQIKSALIKPAPEGGWQLLVEYEGGRSDRYVFNNRAECVNFITAITPDPDRLPCGCLKTCDPYAHDTAWNWDGTPDANDDIVSCADCGERIERPTATDEGEYICSACAAEYAAENAEIQRCIEREDDYDETPYSERVQDDYGHCGGNYDA